MDQRQEAITAILVAFSVAAPALFAVLVLYIKAKIAVLQQQIDSHGKQSDSNTTRLNALENGAGTSRIVSQLKASGLLNNDSSVPSGNAVGNVQQIGGVEGAGNSVASGNSNQQQ